MEVAKLIRVNKIGPLFPDGPPASKSSKLALQMVFGFMKRHRLTCSIETLKCELNTEFDSGCQCQIRDLLDRAESSGDLDGIFDSPPGEYSHNEEEWSEYTYTYEPTVAASDDELPITGEIQSSSSSSDEQVRMSPIRERQQSSVSETVSKPEVTEKPPASPVKTRRGLKVSNKISISLASDKPQETVIRKKKKLAVATVGAAEIVSSKGRRARGKRPKRAAPSEISTGERRKVKVRRDDSSVRKDLSQTRSSTSDKQSEITSRAGSMERKEAQVLSEDSSSDLDKIFSDSPEEEKASLANSTARVIQEEVRKEMCDAAVEVTIDNHNDSSDSNGIEEEKPEQPVREPSIDTDRRFSLEHHVLGDIPAKRIGTQKGDSVDIPPAKQKVLLNVPFPPRYSIQKVRPDEGLPGQMAAAATRLAAPVEANGMEDIERSPDRMSYYSYTEEKSVPQVQEVRVRRPVRRRKRSSESESMKSPTPVKRRVRLPKNRGAEQPANLSPRETNRVEQVDREPMRKRIPQDIKLTKEEAHLDQNKSEAHQRHKKRVRVHMQSDSEQAKCGRTRVRKKVILEYSPRSERSERIKDENSIGQLSPKLAKRRIERELRRQEDATNQDLKTEQLMFRSDASLVVSTQPDRKCEADVVEFMPEEEEKPETVHRRSLGDFLHDVSSDSAEAATPKENSQPALQTSSQISDTHSFPVRVRIVEARNVPRVNDSREPDPYCLIMMKGRTTAKKTKTLEGTTSPKWNQQFELMCGATQSKMILQIKNEDIVSGDQAIASVTVDLLQLCQSQQVDKWFYCESNDGPTDCEVHLVVERDIRQQISELSVSLSENIARMKLDFTVMEAKGMPIDDYMIIARIRGYQDIIRTRVVQSDRPKWQERFKLFVPKPQEDTFGLILRKRDKVNGDDDVGVLAMPVSEIPFGVKTDKWFDLTPTRGHVDSEMKVRLVFRTEITEESLLSETSCQSSLVTRGEGKHVLTGAILAGNGFGEGEFSYLVRITGQSEASRTIVITDTQRETFTFMVDDVSKGTLVVIVENEGDEIGTVNVPISTLRSGRRCDKWYAFDPPGQGSLHLDLKLEASTMSTTATSSAIITPVVLEIAACEAPGFTIPMVKASMLSKTGEEYGQIDVNGTRIELACRHPEQDIVFLSVSDREQPQRRSSIRISVAELAKVAGTWIAMEPIGRIKLKAPKENDLSLSLDDVFRTELNETDLSSLRLTTAGQESMRSSTINGTKSQTSSRLQQTAPVANDAVTESASLHTVPAIEAEEKPRTLSKSSVAAKEKTIEWSTDSVAVDELRSPSHTQKRNLRKAMYGEDDDEEEEESTEEAEEVQPEEPPRKAPLCAQPVSPMSIKPKERLVENFDDPAEREARNRYMQKTETTSDSFSSMSLHFDRDTSTAEAKTASSMLQKSE